MRKIKRFDFCPQISDSTGIPEYVVEKILKEQYRRMEFALKTGSKVWTPAGWLTPVNRKPRNIYMPETGQHGKTKGKRIKFERSRSFEAKLNNGDIVDIVVACEECGRKDCIDGTDGRCMNCGAKDQI